MAATLLSPSLRSWALRILISMAALSPPSQAAPRVSQLYQFTYPTSVQNLFPLPNGCLLLSTSANSDLHYIDPEAIYPSAQNVVTLPGTVALAGFAALGDGLYAVNGGTPPPSSSSGSMQLSVIRVSAKGDDVNVTVDHTVAVPGTSSMEGMAALPAHPRTILSADAIQGRILRVDTASRAVSVAFAHDALKPGDNGNPTARGIKGLKIRGSYLYFTNSAQRTFGRFPIDANGTNTGGVEILASLNDTPTDGASYGDFSFDSQGNAFVAVHPSSIHKITPAGAQTVFAGGVNSTFLEPTSAVVSNNGKSIYVSTAGKYTGYPISGGQVLKVQV
ncbi:putative calcium-dependent phosphotriesterase [Rosellinia necatrix]|uniref:Putative calcium-dependent phosphotriesterase n=1 Tax=Rosellinia necatrix TaxID=77044 RepID=A0A1W2TR68_ROSNE|nr:putative calcium-dependent phosphotriesterase [Rosellinia necatrix]